MPSHYCLRTMLSNSFYSYRVDEVTSWLHVSSHGYDTKNRIEPLFLKDAKFVIRLMYRIVKQRSGEEPESFAVHTHHPNLAPDRRHP